MARRFGYGSFGPDPLLLSFYFILATSVIACCLAMTCYCEWRDYLATPIRRQIKDK